MKRTMVILLLLAGAIICAVPAMATSTRDMGMGLYEYPWFVDGLQSYIYENPAYLDRFKERAYAERIGIEDGRNQGGIIFNPAGKVTLGFHFGVPVDTNLWNTTNVDGLFHVDTYSMCGKSKYVHSTSGQAMKGYQTELLDNTILDLKDPVDASYPVTSGLGSTVSPELREQLGQNNFSAMFAYDFGNFLLGADFRYATSWKNNTLGDSTGPIKEEYNLVNTEYAAKVGAMIPVNAQVSVDVVGSFNLYSLDNNYSKTAPGINMDMSYGSKGSMDFGGSARVNYQMTTKHKMHFNVSYSMLNRTTEGSVKVRDTSVGAPDINGNYPNDAKATDTFERTGQIISLGVSDEYAIDSNVRAFMGFNAMFETLTNNYYGEDSIEAKYNNNKYSKDYTAIKVPLIVGMEAKLSENWKGRFGVRQTIYQPLSNEGESATLMPGDIVTKAPASVSEISSAETDFSMGLSYKLNNFSFDWLANIELFTVGPNFISGKAWTSQQQNPMAMAFAITYVFSTDEDRKGSATVLSPK